MNLPEAFRSSAVPRWSHRDPIEGGNPFPPSSPDNRTWECSTVEAQRTLKKTDASIEAAAKVTLDPCVYRSQLFDLLAVRFNAWARRGASVVSSVNSLCDYKQWLRNYAKNWLHYVSETCPHVETGDDLRRLLEGLVADWSDWASGSLSHLRTPRSRLGQQIQTPHLPYSKK